MTFDDVPQVMISGWGTTQPDCAIEAIVMNVYVLSCGCIQAETRPELSPDEACKRAEIRYTSARDLLPVPEQRVVVTIRSTAGGYHERHGQIARQIPMRLWSDEVTRRAHLTEPQHITGAGAISR